MTVLPPSRIARLEWFEQRLAAWLADPAAIGLTPDQITQLQSEIDAARTTYTTQQQARNDAMSATVAFYNNEDALAADGRDLIKAIKAFAETSNDPNVYVLANVPPPADPTPAGDPGTPTNITTFLSTIGHIKLAWKATDAAASSGAYVIIERRLNDEQTFTLLGTTGTKTFTDTTVPLGTRQATYVITPKRGDRTGAPSNQVTVQFGVDVPSPGNASAGDTGLNIAA